jgi:hypothetical protein
VRTILKTKRQDVFARSRDAKTFPELDRRRQEIGAPVYYYTNRRRWGARWTQITLDAFFVPEPLRVALHECFRPAPRIWCAKGSGRPWPKGGFVIPNFRDYECLMVPTEYAGWWITVLSACAPYCYNPWELDSGDGLGPSRRQAYALWEATPLVIQPPWVNPCEQVHEHAGVAGQQETTR